VAAVDCIYVAASSRDARFTRICIASIRYFYPDIRIRLLPGGPLQPDLVTELQRYWNIDVAPLPGGDAGWGFVKLEPLFGAAGERFLVLDSDTVLAGPVLDVLTGTRALFVVDDEQQTDADTRRLYYDWDKVRSVNPSTRRPQFVFNSGQWFGTAGVLTREDFAPWLEWTMPRRLRYPDRFMPGDQGVLNYVLNQKAALEGLAVERRPLMRWPGHGMQGLVADSVARKAGPSLVVHWAGMKKARLGSMAGADLLTFFERQYYLRLPSGNTKRILAGCLDASSNAVRFAGVWLRLASRRLRWE
jgi:hypothetical protein